MARQVVGARSCRLFVDDTTPHHPYYTCDLLVVHTRSTNLGSQFGVCACSRIAYHTLAQLFLFCYIWIGLGGDGGYAELIYYILHICHRILVSGRD